MTLDILLLVPFDHASSGLLEAGVRQTVGAHFHLPLFEAAARLESFLGCPVPRSPFEAPGPSEPRSAHRSLSAVALATHLERAGLRWHAIDPGPWALWEWRRALRRIDEDPLCIAICSTFVSGRTFLQMLCELLRSRFPTSKLLLGGYYYATNTKEFFELDVDVACVGEGEERLPRIVRAIKEGGPLEGIPGLYLRAPNTEVRYTGAVDQLDLHELPPVDWSLAARMEPPLDPDNALLQLSVETQRGCVFKCEFCTYRTLAGPNMLAPSFAADRILDAARSRDGHLFLVDATGSFPPKRWKAVLAELIDKGFSRPSSCYARVSDIDEEAGRLMARAGFVHCFIGQESGDDRILRRMKKGTKARHVAPAIRALGAAGVSATFGFIHGFPGEDAESLEATRAMLISMNEGFEQSPVAFFYNVSPLLAQDFASVTYSAEFERDGIVLSGAQQMPMEKLGREIMKTFVMTSQVPHAPLSSWLLGPTGALPRFETEVVASPRRDDWFHWAKSVERGVAAFIEADLRGEGPDRAELERLRRRILDPSAGARPSRAFRAARALSAGVVGRLRREWASEAFAGTGLVTRLALAMIRWRSTGRLRSLVRSEGRSDAPRACPAAAEFARTLALEAVDRGRRAKLNRGGAGPSGAGQLPRL